MSDTPASHPYISPPPAPGVLQVGARARKGSPTHPPMLTCDTFVISLVSDDNEVSAAFWCRNVHCYSAVGSAPAAVPLKGYRFRLSHF